MLRRFDAVCSQWMDRAKALGSAKTIMAFVVAAGQLMADKCLYQGMVDEATTQGQKAASGAAGMDLANFMRCLGKAAKGGRLTKAPKKEEMDGACPWPAVIWVHRLVTCWEEALPKALEDAPMNNSAMVAMMTALAGGRQHAPTANNRGTLRAREEKQEGRAVRPRRNAEG